jgi:hypothetical protein
MYAVALMTSGLITGVVLIGQVSMAADDVRMPVPGGTIIIPPSSIPKPGDAGKAAHTNIEIFRPSQPLVPVERPAQPTPSPGDKPDK